MFEEPQSIVGRDEELRSLDASRITPWALRAGDHLDWSPDGTRILFHSNQDGPATVSANLYTIRPDGKGLRQLTHARGGSVQYASSSFSPNGKWITFARRTGESNADVFIMRADGTRVQNVARSKLWDSAPDWGPTPERLMPPFRSWAAGRPQAVRATGQPAAPMTHATPPDEGTSTSYGRRAPKPARPPRQPAPPARTTPPSPRQAPAPQWPGTSTPTTRRGRAFPDARSARNFPRRRRQ